MVPANLSRRAVISVGAALSAALAGCNDTFSGGRSDGDSTATSTPPDDPAPEDRLPANAITDLDVLTVRDSTTDPFLTFESDSETRSRQFLLTDDADVDQIAVEREPEGVDAIRPFLEATDFAERSVAVHQGPVDECYVHHVEYVEASDRRYSVQFCAVLRDATVECDADARDLQATLVRFPYAYDDEPNRRSSGRSSRCLLGPPDPDEIGGDEA